MFLVPPPLRLLGFLNPRIARGTNIYFLENKSSSPFIFLWSGNATAAMWFWGWIKGDGPCSWHHLHPLFADGASSLGRYLGNNYRGQFTAGQEVQIICCQIRRFGKTQMTWGNFGRGRAGGRAAVGNKKTTTVTQQTKPSVPLSVQPRRGKKSRD